jgi:hypothetical protein
MIVLGTIMLNVLAEGDSRSWLTLARQSQAIAL